MNGAADPSGLISLGAVFTLLFVTLGPLKILGPYALQTQALSAIELRGIAVRAFVLATVSVVAGGFVGQYLLQSWSIPVSGMKYADQTQRDFDALRKAAKTGRIAVVRNS